MTTSLPRGPVTASHLLLTLVATVTLQVTGSSSSAGARTAVNDDSWHTVFLRRHRDTIQLTVDDRQATPATGTKLYLFILFINLLCIRTLVFHHPLSISFQT